MNLHIVGGKNFTVIERSKVRFALDHDPRVTELPVAPTVGPSDAAFEPIRMAGVRIAGRGEDRRDGNVSHVLASPRILREIPHENDGPALTGSLNVKLRERIEDAEF